MVSSERDIMPARSTSPPPLAVRRASREVGAHVRTWRKLRGLTQNQVADRAGIDRKSLMRVERADGAVSFQVVLRVLHALGVLDGLPEAVDPYASDIGRMRADEQLPQRVHPRKVKRDDG